jgi:GNAT superfamily N-acetyltransferase
VKPTELAPELVIRQSTPVDLDILATLNRELIEDEGHRNPMTILELRQRFERFVTQEGWSVDIFLVQNELAGFATHRYEPDNTEPSGMRVHLRQFYIARHSRRSGIGRSALELLIQTRFKEGDRIFLDVLEANPGGRIFWSRTGFTPYGTIMERVVERVVPHS